MINHKYNTDTNILEVVYSGRITNKDLENFGEYIMNEKQLPRNLNILTDAGKAIYDLERINFRKMVKDMEKHLQPYIFVKNALIHEKPNETAVSMIFERNSLFSNYKQKIFCTKKAALNWLKEIH